MSSPIALKRQAICGVVVETRPLRLPSGRITVYFWYTERYMITTKKPHREDWASGPGAGREEQWVPPPPPPPPPHHITY